MNISETVGVTSVGEPLRGFSAFCRQEHREDGYTTYSYDVPRDRIGAALAAGGVTAPAKCDGCGRKTSDLKRLKNQKWYCPYCRKRGGVS